MSHRKRIDLALMLVAIVAAISTIMAFRFAEPAAAQTVSVDIQPNAQLLQSGAVRLQVQIACPRGMDVLEAHVSVSQDDQTISGQSGLRVQCTGNSRPYTTVVTPLEGQFHTGTANSSAFVLVQDPATGTTQQGSDTEPNLMIS